MQPPRLAANSIPLLTAALLVAGGCDLLRPPVPDASPEETTTRDGGGSRPGDADGDGIPDSRDLDADGDGIPNRLETPLGIDPEADYDRDGVPNYRDVDDRGDGTRNDCTDVAPPKGVCDGLGRLWDTDGDGVPNHLDTDADGDSVEDSREAGLGAAADDDGRMACASGVGKNGLCDALERPADSGVVAWAGAAGDAPADAGQTDTAPHSGGLPDHDGDGVADFLDPDYKQRTLLPVDRLVEPGTGTSGTRSPSQVLGVAFENSASPAGRPTSGRFVLATDEAGLEVPQAPFPVVDKALVLTGGAAAVDIDADGDVDILFPRVDGVRTPPGIGLPPPAPPSSIVFWNDGKGRFTAVDVDLRTRSATSALLFDQDGDGRIDVVAPSLAAVETSLLMNVGSRPPMLSFVPRELPVLTRAYSASAADYDGDGLVDLFLTHGPLAVVRRDPFLLRNAGPASFKDVTEASSVPPLDRALTALWADVDLDAWPDLLVTADQHRTTALLNRLGVFQRAPVELTDENATGQLVGDLDNDGDLDWFISGIWVDQRSQLPKDLLADGEVGISGNRLMRNDGGGAFVDVTDESGVRAGWWGWGSCAADLNNDGYLDLVQVNGYPNGVFKSDPTQVWLNQGALRFVEAHDVLGLKDSGDGRAVLCADFDGDGDVDVVTVNHAAPPSYWRNEYGWKNNWLELDLVGRAPNATAVGAKVIVKSAGLTQYREVQAGSSYATQQPYRQHLGLGRDAAAHVTVIWPDQRRTEHDLPANRVHVLRAPR